MITCYIYFVCRCFNKSKLFPPENPLWCRQSSVQLPADTEQLFAVACCKGVDYCNRALRPTLNVGAPGEMKVVGVTIGGSYGSSGSLSCLVLMCTMKSDRKSFLCGINLFLCHTIRKLFKI
jgi:hypothetical protein